MPDPSPNVPNDKVNSTDLPTSTSEEMNLQHPDIAEMLRKILNEARKTSEDSRKAAAVVVIAQYESTHKLGEGSPGPTAKGFYGLH